MGKGKGSPEQWIARVKQGRILFEMDGVDLSTAEEALRLAAMKLPLATRILSKETRGCLS